MTPERIAFLRARIADERVGHGLQADGKGGDIAWCEWLSSALDALEEVRGAFAGQVDPIFSSSLREQIRSQLVEQLGKKVAELEHALSVEQDAGAALNAILAEADRRAKWLTEECRKGGTCYVERDQAVHHRDSIHRIVKEKANASRKAQDPGVPVCEAHGRPDPSGICAWVQAEKARLVEPGPDGCTCPSDLHDLVEGPMAGWVDRYGPEAVFHRLAEDAPWHLQSCPVVAEMEKARLERVGGEG